MKKLRSFKIGKGVHQGCILSPCLFNLHAEYIMWNAGLDEPQAGIKIARRNINNLRYADDTTLMAESKEPLDESERGEWKSWLKTQCLNSEDHGIWSNHFMANSWGNSGNSDRFYFLRLQNHCRWWLQPWNYKILVPGRKAMTNLDSIFKNRDITLPAKVHLVKAMVFL